MCTNLLLKSNQNQVFSARTMDFWERLDTKIHLIERGRKHYPVFDKDQNGDGELVFSWKNKYGYLAIKSAGTAIEIYGKEIKVNLFADGMNEHGLSGAALWSNCAQFPSYKYGANNILCIQLPTYVLGMCANIDEVEREITQLNILGLYEITPQHYVFTDAHGESLIVEFKKHVVTTHRITNGVLTNSPFYDEQLQNLKKYSDLTFHNTLFTECFGKKVEEMNGSGLIGLPSDATPMSRFVKASIFSNIDFKPESQQNGVSHISQVIGNFYVPHGTILKKNSDEVFDYTLWSVIREHGGYDEINLWIQSFENPGLFKIELNKLNWDHPQDKVIDIYQNDWYSNLTSKLS